MNEAKIILDWINVKSILKWIENKAGFDPNQPRGKDGKWGKDGEKLENEEIVAVDDYVNDGFEPLNQYLRSNKSKDNSYTKSIAEMERLEKYLTSGLGKMDDYNGVVYRGLDLGGENPNSWALNHKLRSGELTFKTFLSTSKDISFPNDILKGGRGGGKYLFEITSRTGKILGDYGIKGEGEILYPPGMSFNVDKFELINGIYKIKLSEK